MYYLSTYKCKNLYKLSNQTKQLWVKGCRKKLWLRCSYPGGPVGPGRDAPAGPAAAAGRALRDHGRVLRRGLLAPLHLGGQSLPG